ncbi:MAG: hypothetical protein LUC98_06455 [Lachnospiraceae bacterium]|nr:hypothetical protein [Lachnospiraceae bacterium]
MHMIEGWGSGIPDMFMDAKQYGLPEPTLEDRGSDFRVNLYLRTLETDLFGVVNPKNVGDNENSSGTNNPDADKVPENADKVPIKSEIEILGDLTQQQINMLRIGKRD